MMLWLEGNPLQPTAGVCDQPLLTFTLPCDTAPAEGTAAAPIALLLAL